MIGSIPLTATKSGLSSQMRESLVVATYGIPKAELQEFRRTLEEGKMWVRERSGDKPATLCPVTFTEEGLKTVLVRFGVNQSKPAEISPDALSAKVVRCDFPNRRIMSVIIEGSDKPVTVQTFNAGLFYHGAIVTLTRRGNSLICLQKPISKEKLFTNSNRTKPADK